MTAAVSLQMSAVLSVWLMVMELEFDKILIISFGGDQQLLFFVFSAHPNIDTPKQYSGKYCCEAILPHIASRAA